MGPNNTLERIIPNVDDLFIIHINNKYVGSFVLNYSSFVTFNNIYINELYRCRDLCNKFISIGIKYSNKKHYELTVLNNNIPAYKCYIKAGFKPYKNYKKIIYMKKLITNGD